MSFKERDFPFLWSLVCLFGWFIFKSKKIERNTAFLLSELYFLVLETDLKNFHIVKKPLLMLVIIFYPLQIPEKLLTWLCVIYILCALKLCHRKW